MENNNQSQSLTFYQMNIWWHINHQTLEATPIPFYEKLK